MNKMNILENKQQSPIKITLNHPIYKNESSKIVNINNKDKKYFTHLNNSPEKFKEQTDKYNNEKDKQCSCQQADILRNLLRTQTVFLNNGIFYYHVNTKSNKSIHMGIYIDNEFNYFLSNFKKHSKANKMNGLTYIRLHNKIQIYGTFINGQMNGYNVITINGLSIYINTKGNNIQICLGNHINKWNQHIVIFNKLANIAYIMRINHQHKQMMKQFPKLQIVQRTDINNYNHNHNNKYHQPTSIQSLLNKHRIPEYLYSTSEYLTYLSQHNRQVQFKQVQLNQHQQLFYFLSLNQHSNQQQYKSNSDKVKPFNPYFDQIKPSFDSINKNIHNHNNNKLGILIDTNNLRTKCIGMFNQQYRLNGLGLTSNKQTKIIGIFKNDFITHEFYYGNLLEKKENNSQYLRQMKTSIKNQNIKSLNYKNQFVYFKQINQIAQINKKINKFVTLFQKAFQQKSNETSKCTQNSLEFQNINLKYNTQKRSNIIPLRQNNLIQNVIYKQKSNMNKNTPQKQQQRIFYGKIVNSRSPLRNKSRSPSQLQTNRKTQYLLNQNNKNRTPLRKNYNYLNDIQNSRQSFTYRLQSNPKHLLLKMQNNYQYSYEFTSQSTSKHKKYLQKTKQEEYKYFYQNNNNQKKQLKKVNDVNTNININEDENGTVRYRKNTINEINKNVLYRKQPQRQIFWKVK